MVRMFGALERSRTAKITAFSEQPLCRVLRTSAYSIVKELGGPRENRTPAWSGLQSDALPSWLSAQHLVRVGGFEPPRLSTAVFKTAASYQFRHTRKTRNPSVLEGFAESLELKERYIPLSRNGEPPLNELRHDRQ